MLVAVSVLAVAHVVQVRAALVAAAAEGARAAALAGADPGAARRRVDTLLAGTAAGASVRTVRLRSVVEAGVPVVEVRIEADVPGLGLLGPFRWAVAGHALREGAT